jgi:hypothetical protein
VVSESVCRAFLLDLLLMKNIGRPIPVKIATPPIAPPAVTSMYEGMRASGASGVDTLELELVA